MKIEGNTEVLEYQDQIAASTGAGTNGHVKSEVLDCLFIQPPFKYKSDSIWKNVRSDDPPIGLMSLAAYVRTRNYKAEILDCNIVAPDIEEFERYIIDTYAEESRRPRVVGITTTILTVLKAFELAEIFKKHYPDTLMVFGGQHATFMPEECAEKDYVDVVVLSEGEYTLEEILEGKELSEIDGIAYQTVNGKGETVVTKTKPRKRIDDLDTVPFVAYDMLDLPKYTPILGSYKRLPAMMMVTSRGCPWTCSFCRGAFDTKVGFRSAKRIFEEINYLIDNYGIKEILFMDDVFTINKKNVIALCDLIIEHKTDITWVCFARVDIVDQEMLTKMKRAGCHQIMYGVENFDQGILNSVRKKITKDQVFEAIAWTKKAEIDIRLCFLVGLPGDTEAIIMNNIKLMNLLDPDYVVINIVMPLPGTSLYSWAKSQGVLNSENWDDYYAGNPIIELEDLTFDDIKRLHLKMITSFYMRPSYILKRLRRLGSWTELKMLTIGFFGVLGYVLGRVSAFFRKMDAVDHRKGQAAITKDLKNPEAVSAA